MTLPAARARSVPLLAAGALAALLALPSSCGAPPDTPEGQVRSLVARAEEAAEAKDISTLKGMISERYGDRGGNSRDSVLGILRYHFLRNQSIHLLTRVGSVTFPSPAVAEVTLFAAMAADPIPSAAQLELLRADLYRFDLVLAEEEKGSWRMTGASWRPAGREDFL